jgi:aryl-alcohol dehydrogenase-like predicted oxidoreductase
MKTCRIANTPLETTRINHGCMGIGGGWAKGPLAERMRKEALSAVNAALDEGITFFDSAADTVEMTREEWYALLAAGSGRSVG